MLSSLSPSLSVSLAWLGMKSLGHTFHSDEHSFAVVKNVFLVLNLVMVLSLFSFTKMFSADY